MSRTAKERWSRRQLAIRRMLLDGRGELTADARVLVADMRTFCYADGKPAIKFSPQTGTVDPIATACAVARREVFDRYMRLLLVDRIVIENISGDE